MVLSVYASEIAFDYNYNKFPNQRFVYTLGPNIYAGTRFTNNQSYSNNYGILDIVNYYLIFFSASSTVGPYRLVSVNQKVEFQQIILLLNPRTSHKQPTRPKYTQGR